MMIDELGSSRLLDTWTDPVSQPCTHSKSESVYYNIHTMHGYNLYSLVLDEAKGIHSFTFVNCLQGTFFLHGINYMFAVVHSTEHAFPLEHTLPIWSTDIQ